VRLHEDAKSDRPIRAVWEDFNHAISAWLDFEYMALANHHDGVRQVLVQFLAEAREIHVGIIEKVYREKGLGEGPMPPAALAFLITHTSMALVREEGTGFTVGHAELRDTVDRFFRTLE